MLSLSDLPLTELVFCLFVLLSCHDYFLICYFFFVVNYKLNALFLQDEVTDSQVCWWERRPQFVQFVHKN